MDVEQKDIRCMIMVNFIHAIPPEDLRNMVKNVIGNGVDIVVFDTFKENKGTEYIYSHDGDYLFEGNYKLARRSKGFQTNSGARRYIEWWVKK